MSDCKECKELKGLRAYVDAVNAKFNTLRDRVLEKEYDAPTITPDMIKPGAVFEYPSGGCGVIVKDSGVFKILDVSVMYIQKFKQIPLDNVYLSPNKMATDFNRGNFKHRPDLCVKVVPK